MATGSRISQRSPQGKTFTTASWENDLCLRFSRLPEMRFPTRIDRLIFVPEVTNAQCDLLFLGEPRLQAFVHFLRRDVFLMCGHPPQVPERIFELAGAVAVKLIHDGLTLLGAGSQRPFEKRVDVVDVEMDADRRAA